MDTTVTFQSTIWRRKKARFQTGLYVPIEIEMEIGKLNCLESGSEEDMSGLLGCE